jgi:GNAT superfamily N-acetyltransferase
LVEELSRFEHPEVERIAITRESSGDDHLVQVGLYDCCGNYIIKDVEIASGFAVPGLAITVGRESARIETIYLRETAKGKGIGTSFVTLFERAAAKAGIKKISLVADEETDAKPYWTKLGYRPTDNSVPLYLEKDLGIN